MSLPLDRAALIVVDVQQGFADVEYWGDRNNPDAEQRIAELIEDWQRRGWPIVVVQHASTSPASPLRPGVPGHDLQPGVPIDPDLLVTKSVNSGFHGSPDLHGWLQRESIAQVVICGITTNHCCESTARISGNLGYDTYFALDATYTFDRHTPEGEVLTADELARATAANLHGEFATVMRTRALLS